MNPISNIPPLATVTSAHDSGLSAIAAGNQKLSADAQAIANPDSTNVIGALVDLNQALALAEAGADAISTENKMLGALFDALA